MFFAKGTKFFHKSRKVQNITHVQDKFLSDGTMHITGSSTVHTD